MRRVSVLLLLNIVFFSCIVNNSSKEIDNKIFVELDSLPILPQSAIDTIFFVPLEVNDSSLVADFPIIRFGGSDIYVYSDRSTNIVRYDRNGKVQNVIDHKGQSGEDYVSISDFFATEEGVFIYDGIKNSLLHYDKEGCFRSSILFGVRGCNNIASYGNGFLLTKNNPSHKDKALYILNHKGDLKNKFIKNKNYSLERSFMSHNMLSVKGELSYMVYLFDMNIYCFDGESCFVKYRFDFGKYNLSHPYVEENVKNINLFVDLQRTHNVVYGFESPAFSDNWIYMTLWLSGSNVAEKIYINKLTGKIYKQDNSDNIFSLSSFIWTVFGNYFVTTISAANIMSMKEYPQFVKFDHNIRLMNIDVDEESNPVVCFIRLKDDFKE